MSKEKLTPPTRAVPSSGGLKEADHSTITTPKDNQGSVWNRDKEQTNKLFGK